MSVMNLLGFHNSQLAARVQHAACLGAFSLITVLYGGSYAMADAAEEEENEKQIIGATAIISEASTGIPFLARVDTGAKSCALHCEEIEIEHDDSERNRGMPIRFKIKNLDGESEWIETKIVSVVRIKSSSLKDGRYDRRFKVRLTLKWEDFEKEVEVNLDNRGDMTYPLLIGRNFLRDDFLVDVALDSPDVDDVVDD